MWLLLIFFFYCWTALVGLGLLYEFPSSHSDIPLLVGLLGSSDRPLLDHTQHSQETDSHAPSGIENRNARQLAALDPRLRPHCHWEWRLQQKNISKFQCGHSSWHRRYWTSVHVFWSMLWALHHSVSALEVVETCKLLEAFMQNLV